MVQGNKNRDLLSSRGFDYELTTLVAGGCQRVHRFAEVKANETWSTALTVPKRRLGPVASTLICHLLWPAVDAADHP